MLEKIKRLRKVVRWLLLPILIWFALQHLDELWQTLKDSTLNGYDLIPAFMAVLGIFIGQAGVTQTLVKACDTEIEFKAALYLNTIGGFWGLVLPFGSMGYKAQRLKREYQVPLKLYGSLFMVSLSSSLWVSSMLLCFGLLFFNKTDSVWLFLCLGLMVSFIGACLPFFKSRLSRLKAQVAVAFMTLNWMRLSAWHAFGLFTYIVLYYFCFESLNIHVNFFYLSVWVAIQSFLFLAPLVPANLVIMEALGALLLANANASPHSIVLGIALMRLVCMVGLFFFAPFAFKYQKKETTGMAG